MEYQLQGKTQSGEWVTVHRFYQVHEAMRILHKVRQQWPTLEHRVIVVDSRVPTGLL